MSIKNKIADCIATCISLSDVFKLIRQVRREMENREAFTGISAEPDETVEEVRWRQNNHNQRGRGYPEGVAEAITIHPIQMPEGEVTIPKRVVIQEVVVTLRSQVTQVTQM